MCGFGARANARSGKPALGLGRWVEAGFPKRSCTNDPSPAGINYKNRKSAHGHKLVHLVGQSGGVDGEYQYMSDTAELQTRPTTRGDQQILALVEKWMATIREVSHERSDVAVASTRLDRLLASATK